MSGHISMSGDANFAIMKIQYDDKKDVDPTLNATNIDLHDQQRSQDVAGNVGSELVHDQQRTQDALGKNLRADQDATTGKTDDQIAMEQRIHAIAQDGIVPAEQGARQIQALASIQSKLLDAPTERQNGLESFNIRAFDNTQRA